MSDILLVFCTFPDIEKARLAGTALIDSQLAACVNLCPGIESIYRWQGQVETSTEVLAIFKTTPQTYQAFESRLRELHPYDVPEIIATPAMLASETYARWLNEELDRKVS